MGLLGLDTNFDIPSASSLLKNVGLGNLIGNNLGPDSFYKAESKNWFTAKPYGFMLTMRDGSPIVCYLPISPSNLTINTNFATNVIPTLYGTVEEHSSVRYYDITIEGTTGFAPRYPSTDASNMGGAASNASSKVQGKDYGRKTFEVNKDISLGGFFSKTLGAINQIKNQATDLLGGNEPKTGIDPEQTGYMAFHNLYRFLLQYKADAAGLGSGGPGALLSGLLSSKRSKHPLIFFNYKDNNQYQVVIKNFVLRRSADNPMLYFYSISMRGYALATVSSNFPNENITQRLTDLGLDGVDSSSLLGSIKKKANGVRGILGSAVGGISVLGR